MNFSDYISQAITPLFKFMMGIGLGLLIYSFFVNPGLEQLSRLRTSYSEERGDGKHIKQSRVGSFVVKAALVIQGWFWILSGTIPLEIAFGIFFVSLPFFHPFWDKYIERLIPIESLQGRFIILYLLFLLFTPAVANLNATLIKASEMEVRINSLLVQDRVFIGKAGSHFFLWNKKRSRIEIHSSSKVKLLIVQNLPHEKTSLFEGFKSIFYKMHAAENANGEHVD
ncbi:hypothetical protein [Alteromonas stellipolaris]|uniref:hypothetical protein n=1 Tax=Alteromonas stellipolaris TaxID=233316 RepID=UPI001D377546|nr:hypothetical protein [Alteromonas stellipolaris]MBZ2163190.1 hypothetical protein [Alteromonas stellipolaris]